MMDKNTGPWFLVKIKKDYQPGHELFKHSVVRFTQMIGCIEVARVVFRSKHHYPLIREGCDFTVYSHPTSDAREIWASFLRQGHDIVSKHDMASERNQK